MNDRRADWSNILSIAGVHLLGAVGIVYLAAVHFSWWTVGLAALWYGLIGLSITGGYHRLFAHRSFAAAAPYRAFVLLFGAGALQNSALKWSRDHRVHHERSDEAGDPYSIRQGFWWAHIGWILFKTPGQKRDADVADLAADPLVQFQERHYLACAAFMILVLPALLGLAWGDPLGAVLVAGFLRLVFQWHATFSVNSFAHWFGSQPYCRRSSARDSVVTALISLGEGYHNFHHRFQADYRNGIRWFHFDPTKWIVWAMSKVGLAWDLRRTPRDAIERARQSVVPAGS